MVEISEDIFEAAWVAFRDSDKPAIYNQVKDAVQAALARAEANAGEPVADADIAGAMAKADWSGVSIGNKALIRAAISRLTHPDPQPSEPVEVKPLEWVEAEYIDDHVAWYAQSIVGRYEVGFDDGWYATLDDYKWEWQPENDCRTYLGPSSAQQAAQADYERRILSALTAGKPEKAVQSGPTRECATEGCGNPAGVYFERGGVGSHYCGECYLKVQALPAAPTAGGGDAE